MRAYFKPLLLLKDTYPAVAANPPYASNSNMNQPLKNYLKEHYPEAKKDLFATFMEVFPNHTLESGRFAFITPPNWMFLNSFEDLRRYYIDNYFFESLLHLSRGIFGADFGSVATAVQKAAQSDRTGTYFRLIERTFQEFHVGHLRDLFHRVMDDPDFHYDFSEYKKDGSIPDVSDPNGQQLRYPDIDQQDFESIPGAPLAYWAPEELVKAFAEYPTLGDYADVEHGMTTGDNSRFVRFWPEVSRSRIGVSFKSRDEAKRSEKKWFPFNKGGDYRKWYGNRSFILNWKDDGKEIKKNTTESGRKKATIRGEDHYFEEGFTWSKVSSGSFAVRFTPPGAVFDDGGSSLFASKNILIYLGALLNTPISNESLKATNPTLNFQAGDVSDIPVLENSKVKPKVEEVAKNSIRAARKDYDSRETSWDFTRHPLTQEGAASLEGAYNSWRDR
ncbi:MAG: Eco57I restriction-modification methylase domain-containing protein, partial [Candidatus Aenigmatarchaeota archaeon]